MEGGVAVGCGSIWMGHVLQQQLHNLCFSQTGCNVEGSLVLLKMTQKKKNGTSFCMVTKNYSPFWCDALDNSHLTRALASTIAPFLSRHLTTSTWPALAAICNAVSPRCRHNIQQRVDHISQQTHIQLKYALM